MLYDYVNTDIPTTLLSEEITSPIILKVDIGEKANEFCFRLGFTDSLTPITVVSLDVDSAELDYNSNTREIVIFNNGERTHARIDIRRNGEREYLKSNDSLEFNDNDKIYIYINPEKHRIMYFKNGLQQSNMILDYTNTDVIPSSLYLLPPFDEGDGPLLTNYDTSLAGGNIIIPPENWQYA